MQGWRKTKSIRAKCPTSSGVLLTSLQKLFSWSFSSFIFDKVLGSRKATKTVKTPTTPYPGVAITHLAARTRSNEDKILDLDSTSG